MNSVVLLGRMAADPELRQTGNGVPVTSFTIAVDRPFSKGGERQTDWIDIVAWRNTAEFICKYFQKGSPIVITGSLQTRNWEDKSGLKRKSVEVIADTVEFVPRAKDSIPAVHTGSNIPEFAPPIEELAPEVYSAGDAEDFSVIEDEDLPF